MTPHVFNAGTEHDVVDTRSNLKRAEIDGLLSRPALPINCRGCRSHG
jgi:hypothetical protein